MAKGVYTGPRLEIDLKSGSLAAGVECSYMLIDKVFEKLEQIEQDRILKPYSVSHYFMYWDNEMRYMYRNQDFKEDDKYLGLNDEAALDPTPPIKESW